jgi:hypothetical protein
MGRKAKVKLARAIIRQAEQRWQTARGSQTARSVPPETERAPDELAVRVRDAGALSWSSDTVPLAIHTHQMDGNGSHAVRIGRYAGGLRWSPAFNEYIGNAVPRDVAAMQASWKEWWRNPYLVRGVRQRLGVPITDALLLLYNTGRDYDHVARMISRSWTWIARWEPVAWRVAHEVARGVVNTNTAHEPSRQSHREPG